MDQAKRPSHAMVPAKELFRWIQLALFVFHAAAVAVALAGGSDWSVPVFVRYNKWTSDGSDGCAPDAACTLTEKRQTLDGRFYLRPTVASFSIVSGCHHLVAFAFHEWYWRGCVLPGFNPLRVLDYAVTSPLMLLVNDVLWVAPLEVGKLATLLVSQCLVIVCGASSEFVWSRYFRAKSPEAPLRAAAIAFFAVPLALFTALWGVLWYVFSVARRDDGVRMDGLPDNDEVAKPPAFVYAVLITLFATFLVFPVIHGIRIAKKNDGALLDNEKDDFVVLNESAYAFASFASKIPLLILFRFGVSARSDSVVLVDPLGDPAAIRNASSTKAGSEPADAGALAGSTALVSFAVGVVSLLLIRRAQRTANNPNASWF